MAKKRVNDLPDPPDAPEIERRIALQPSQWVLVPLMLALPLLAILGVFGERRETVTARAGPVHATIEYPTILRYKLRGSVSVQLHNTGATSIDTVTIAIDTAYVQHFTQVLALPSLARAYEVDVAPLRAGERQLVRIELVANRQGRHRGELTIATTGADTARVRIATRIFP